MSLLFAAIAVFTANPSVLLITGQNNHDWERTTPMLESILQSQFEVTLSQTPPRGAASAAWDAWRPDFGAYDVVLLNYNGEAWPLAVQADFEAYVAGGGAVLVQHASNNSFRGWEAYESMVGLLWRSPDAGYGAHLDSTGALVRVPPGEGRGAGHGRLHDWQIMTRDAEHPIMVGLPAVWMHPHDELYHSQRGPAEDMHVLASAWSDPKYGGTGAHELMVWWIPYGSGKVLTLLPGHLWRDQDDDRAMRCAGFQTLLQRSVEWLATNAVTIPVPDDFPTADQASVRAW